MACAGQEERNILLGLPFPVKCMTVFLHLLILLIDPSASRSGVGVLASYIPINVK